MAIVQSRVVRSRVVQRQFIAISAALRSTANQLIAWKCKGDE